MFTATKAGQMAAFFADKAGAPVDALKLVTLLYLADRESMRQYGRPVSFDTMISIPDGPALLQTLDLLTNSRGRAAGAAWGCWISGAGDDYVALRRAFERKDLDQLSDADLQVLTATWAKFGYMDRQELRDYARQHCAEWHNPADSQTQPTPIDAFDVFRAVGIAAKEAAELAQELQIEKSLDRAFSPA